MASLIIRQNKDTDFDTIKEVVGITEQNTGKRIALYPKQNIQSEFSSEDIKRYNALSDRETLTILKDNLAYEGIQSSAVISF